MAKDTNYPCTCIPNDKKVSYVNTLLTFGRLYTPWLVYTPQFSSSRFCHCKRNTSIFSQAAFCHCKRNTSIFIHYCSPKQTGTDRYIRVL